MDFAFWAIIGLTTMAMLKLFWMKDPLPVPWITWAVAAAGGLAGGWLYQLVWPVAGTTTGVEAAPAAVGAFIGAVAALSATRAVTRPPVTR